MMKTLVGIAFTVSGLVSGLVFVLGLAASGCGATTVDASQQRLTSMVAQDPACATPKVVYYGLRTADNQGDSPCFGPTADKLAVVECGGANRAFWGFGDRWEAAPGTVTAVAPDHVEISVAQGGSSLEAVAKCGH